jgi:hypothetical protein
MLNYHYEIDVITAANYLYLLRYFVCNFIALKNPIFFFCGRLFNIMYFLLRFCIAQEFISYCSVWINTHFFSAMLSCQVVFLFL